MYAARTPAKHVTSRPLQSHISTVTELSWNNMWESYTRSKTGYSPTSKCMRGFRHTTSEKREGVRDAFRTHKTYSGGIGRTAGVDDEGPVVLIFAVYFYMKRKAVFWSVLVCNGQLDRFWFCWTHLDSALLQNWGVVVHIRQMDYQCACTCGWFVVWRKQRK